MVFNSIAFKIIYELYKIYTLADFSYLMYHLWDIINDDTITVNIFPLTMR